MEEFSKNGRKLRPRKTAGSQERSSSTPAYSTSRNFNRSDRPQHSHSDRPARPYGDRPARPYGERSERPARPYGERSARPDRPARPYGDRPARPYGERSERPARPYGERSARPAGEGRSDRPQRSYGDRPARPYGDRPARPYGSKPSRSFGDRPARPAGKYSDRKPFRKNEEFFTKESDAGINRMISRRPQVDDRYSDNDIVATPIRDEIRLNKFIANSGVCSRREADTLIQAGVVTVNGEVVTELGIKVNPAKDEIKFNGERLKGEEKVYLVMNKPKGYVTTASDPHADKTVMDLLKNCDYRVFPVGRLDKNTTGVLMFTNDGEIAERLTHPSYDKKKIYQVILDRPLAEEELQQILGGIALTDGVVAADSLEYIDESDHRKLGIEIHSGKNRIVRRIFEHFGYDVRALDRVYFAGLTKKGLKKGEWRRLSESEVNILKMGAYV